MKVIKVQNNNFTEEVLEAKIPVLIDFNADWCGPCRMLAPILEEIATEEEKVKIVSINIDEAEDLAKQYNVFSIPCLVLLENKEEKKRTVGFKQKEEIKKFIGE